MLYICRNNVDCNLKYSELLELIQIVGYIRKNAVGEDSHITLYASERYKHIR